jgi:hypothetical protein
LCTEHNTAVYRCRCISGGFIVHLRSSDRGNGIVGSLNGSEAAEGGASLVFYPAILVVRHITLAAHNDVVAGPKLGFAIGANLSGVIIHSW